jgi:hypothetical protein
MATSVAVGYNFRVVATNSEAIAELKVEVKALPSVDNTKYLTLAQFNQFKEAQVADRQWMVDAIYNLHLKIDKFLMGYYNTVPPPNHEHPEGYDSTEVPKKLSYVAPKCL